MNEGINSINITEEFNTSIYTDYFEKYLNKYKITLLTNAPNKLKEIITPYKARLSTKQKIICFDDNKKDLYLTKDSINILVKNDELYLL